MSSTDISRSPHKLILIVVGIVVSLHVLTAMALVLATPSVVIDEVIEATPPVEIQLVSPPVKNDDVAENKSISVEAIPVAEVQPPSDIQNESKPEPSAQPQVSEASKPTVIEEKPTPKINTPKDKKKESKKPPLTQQKTEVISAEAMEKAERHQQRVAAQAHAKAMMQAQADQEAENAKLAAEQARREAQVAAANAQAAKQAAKRAAQEKAAQQAKYAAAQAAKVTAQQAAQAKTVSDEPVGYGQIGKSSWQKEPRFDVIRNKNYRFKRTQIDVNVSVSMSVDANGNISNVKIIKSSGNTEFDRDFIKVLSDARLNPATRNDIPTQSTANLPFRMTL